MGELIMRARIAEAERLADQEWAEADRLMEAGLFSECDDHRRSAEMYQSRANRLKQFLPAEQKEGVEEL